MSFDQYKEIQIKRGAYLAALLAKLERIPLAQVQIWNRRIHRGNYRNLQTS